MTTLRFIHLRLHSEFSITDGIVRIPDAVARAQALRMPALGLSDLMNLCGIVKFYTACRAAGIKPLVACDVWVAPLHERDEAHRLLLIAKSYAGYLRLCALLAQAYTHNPSRARAQLQRQWLEQGDNRQLICLSGAHLGEIGRALANAQHDEARRRAHYWSALFPDNFYLEIQRVDDAVVESVVQHTLWLASETGLPVVATHPIQFMEADDFKAHEARVCIAHGLTLADKRRGRHFNACQSFLSGDDMAARFHDIPEALENTIHIAHRCTVTLPLGKSYLPDFPTPDGMSMDDYLVQRSQEGLAERLLILYPNAQSRAQQSQRYTERLSFETQTITQMGFAGYFLIVADFINWAKNNGCPVGPGRGSGAGSLVAYSLGITDIDPLAYALLFERFLNPERVSMPDFDIDFCQDNRYRVIEYVRQTYGANAVSQIATFGTMAAKAVVRDVGRVLDLPYSFCDQLSKLIPTAPGKQYSLDEALQMEPLLKERLDNEEEVRELWQLAKKLEGLTRNIGMHAGGVLIAPGALTDFCPLYQASGEDTVPVSMYDKDDVEAIGLVKFDFLGLRNLTIINLALHYIKQLDASFDTDLRFLTFTDAATYQVLQQANTTAVFQLESEGMKRLLEKLKPDRFEDIIAVLALYRPGPLGSGMVDDFILRKAGKQKVEYFHPDLMTCLDPTYGVIVYQEQVMQISQIIGGYTLGGADMLRRVMGKKKTEEMATHRSTFIQGALHKGYEQTLAEQLFDLMAKFAEYGFNKSHTAAYAVIAYQTAWLKAHHSAAFMAATMSSELDNTDQLKVLYDDSVANQLQFLPPDINKSYYRFVPVDRDHIRCALGAIKGTGESAVQHIIQVRNTSGPFTDLFDFCHRVDKKLVNKRATEALVRAGAFDCLDANRARMLANVGRCMESAEQVAAHINQRGLFDLLDTNTVPAITMIDTPAWDMATQLAQEKIAIGFYLSGHPFSAYENEIRRFIKTPLSQLSPSKEAQLIAGFVTALRTKMSARGKIAFVQLDDGSAKQEVSLFSPVFNAYRGGLKEDIVLVVEGRVSRDDFSGGLRVVADKIYQLAEARSRHARALQLRVGQQSADVSRLRTLLAAHRNPDNGCPVRVHYHNDQAQGELALPPAWAIQLDDELLTTLTAWLGERAVSILW